MSAHRQVSVRGIEVTRCRVDEVPLSLVVLGQVEGGQTVESPRGRRVPLGVEASRHAPGELRDLEVERIRARVLVVNGSIPGRSRIGPR